MKKFLSLCLTVVMIAGLVFLLGNRGETQAANTKKTKNGWVLEEKKNVTYGSYTGKAKKIKVPSGVTQLTGVSNTVQEIYIPESVQEIFLDYEDLKHMKKYTVNKKNKTFSSKDGVLFEKEGARLLHYPPKKKSSSYKVPTGTKTITLLENHHLKTLKLPKSLRQIEIISSKKVEKLKIPKDVKYIGRLNITGKITVSKNNKYFTMSQGVLFNKKKTKLIYYPPRETNQSYTVPAGVKEIYSSALSDNKHLKTLHLSQSFKWKDTYDFTPFYGLQTPYLEEITVDEENQNFTAQDGVLYSKDMTKMYVYPSGKKDENYTIPNEVGNIGENAKHMDQDIALGGNKSLRNVTLGAWTLVGNEKDYEEMGRADWWWLYTSFPAKARNIHVDEANPMLSSVDGVLFNKAQSDLIYYPSGRTDKVYKVPETVTRIRDYAFENIKKKLTVQLPDKVKSITEASVLWEMDNISYKQGLKILQKKYKNITFQVKKGSVSYKTVKKLGLKYKFY